MYLYRNWGKNYADENHETSTIYVELLVFIIATWLPLHFRPWAWWSSARTPSWESPGWRAAGPRGSSDHSSATIVQHKLCACLQIRNNVSFIIKVLASGVSSDHSFATKVQFKLCLCNLEHRNLFLILSFCLVTWAPCVFQSAIPDTNNTVRKACYHVMAHLVTRSPFKLCFMGAISSSIFATQT